MTVIFYAIVGYLFYRFLTGFLIPIFRTTRHVRQQFDEMNRQRQNGQAGGTTTGSSQSTRKPDTSKVGEYIDFEEVNS
ncbi:MAG TPA: hypothetical protein VG890_05105 [Puia sp.]|nr:hypothetical protein [Puia sp.]